MMKKIVLLGFMSILLCFQSKAQVKDISVTIAPTAEYVWWDDATTLNDNALVGGRIGFGFGQYFEIRGSYMKSIDLKGELQDIDQNWGQDLEEHEVDVTRWGGEVKANIGFDSWIAPYITLGTGVQKLEYDRDNDLPEYKEEQVYASLGLGAKFNISDRVVFAIEGKNTAFNLDNTNQYLDRSESDKENWNNDDNERMYNWSALASLEFYLGGRDPQQSTAFDEAYRGRFSKGTSDFKFSFEPGMLYVDFDDDSEFSDSYFWGGGIGFDITDYIGLRGFYYQGTKEGEFKFETTSSMKLYGGNIVARLNQNTTGVSPYLSLGGGYINVSDDYVGENGSTGVDGSGFAMGGLGIELPISDFLVAYGSANYMLTSTRSGDENLDVEDPSELRNNVAYRAGLRFQIGGSSDDSKSKSYNRSNNEGKDLCSEYRNRIRNINMQLDEAYRYNDLETVVSLLEDRKNYEKQLAYVCGNREGASMDQNMVVMTRGELEDIVDEVVNELDGETYAKGNEQARIKQLEDALIYLNTGAVQVQDKEEEEDTNDKILEELKKLNEKVSENSEMMKSEKDDENVDTVIVNPNTGDKTVVEEDGEVETTASNNNNGWANEGFAVFTGPSFGDDFTWGLGLRTYYRVGNSDKFKFMPEVYFGLAGESAFGLSANFLYQFNDVAKGKIVHPYVGLGLGIFDHEDSEFGANIIVGTELDVLDGRLFIDYSSRDMFENNMLSVGYRFTL